MDAFHPDQIIAATGRNSLTSEGVRDSGENDAALRGGNGRFSSFAVRTHFADDDLDVG